MLVKLFVLPVSLDSNLAAILSYCCCISDFNLPLPPIKLPIVVESNVSVTLTSSPLLLILVDVSSTLSTIPETTNAISL